MPLKDANLKLLSTMVYETGYRQASGTPQNSTPYKY